MSSLLKKDGPTSATHNGENGRTSESDAAPPSYDAFSTDQTVADGRTPVEQRIPPTEDEISKVNLTAAFDKLSLGTRPKFPNVDTCLAHLKLLFAIQAMKEEVGYTDGLWNIWDTRANSGETSADGDIGDAASASVSGSEEVSKKKLAILSKLREKRWAVFLARAVDRYEAWWTSMQKPNGGLTETDMHTPRTEKYDLFVSAGNDLLTWDGSNLPPLDVVMVWHAHMLNPRAFLEDAMLAGHRQLWNTGFPWAAINSAIDNKFNYNVSDDCKSNWTVRTGRSWESVDDPMFKSMQCPACNTPIQIPWTTCGLDETYKGDKKPGIVGNGYGDGNLLYKCPACVVVIDKELLAVSKFCKDTEALLARGRPMPGTVLDPVMGMPEIVHAPYTQVYSRTFPNRMLQRVLRIEVVELIHPGITPHPTMHTVRGMIENVLTSNKQIRAADSVALSPIKYKLSVTARITVRKMMARYWENFTLFALDLGGAVLRQGAFVEKMVKIDWLHSPSAASTMTRLLTKYERFFDIMASHPKNTAVPTLDVDLAWHTHQLSPSDYYAYSKFKTTKFIDHDDKIDEDKLSESFEWTSKVYQEKYGEVYSECTCWYCETIRSAHVSPVGKILGISKQEKVAETFHNSGAASFCPPDNSAHISSHNAVKSFQDPSIPLTGRRKVQAQLAAIHRQRLDDAYAKAQKRAEKKGRKIPPKEQYYDHWGYPYAFYGPYMYPMWLAPGMYYGWAPGYVAACGSGGWASCAAGSCGGGVAAGACGGPGVS
ncbi:hypothetical protein GE09DRAFT_966956 [Coniochaeta sp. 2T2.1]|nr:hypothetical protein GE09DRAFT_966956 [Coniochaeta sp. 2T2.1]